MKNLLVFVAVAMLAGSPLMAVERNATEKELDTIVGKVSEKVSNGKKTEKDLADELKQLDALAARLKEKDDKTGAGAQVAFMKAIVYFQHLHNAEKAEAAIHKLKKDFPNSPQALSADATLTAIRQDAETRKMQASLVQGAAFPEFSVNDINGKPLGITKDKVVLVQFWAAWSSPAMDEIPYLKAAYDKYHAKGFEIVGVTVDTDKNKVLGVTQQQSIPWPQYFDGQGWQNKLALKYGVKTIPTTYLVDGKGNIIAKDLRGSALEEELARALTK